MAQMQQTIDNKIVSKNSEKSIVVEPIRIFKELFRSRRKHI